MKYTNEHIKESYFPYKVLLYIFSIVLVLGIMLVLWGLIATGNQKNNVAPLEPLPIKRRILKLSKFYKK